MIGLRASYVGAPCQLNRWHSKNVKGKHQRLLRSVQIIFAFIGLYSIKVEPILYTIVYNTIIAYLNILGAAFPFIGSSVAVGV